MTYFTLQGVSTGFSRSHSRLEEIHEMMTENETFDRVRYGDRLEAF
jgi:hypothetical protein